MPIELKIPDLGENIESGIVAKVLVSPGDTIAVEQPILELETDKAVLEVPADISGVVKEVLVEEGQQIKVGQSVLVVEATEKAPVVTETAEEEPAAVSAEAGETEPEKPKVQEPAPAVQPEVKPVPEEAVPSPPSGSKEPAPAAPSVRRFAREIGIDIHRVPGSGPGGRISIEDVKNYAKMINRQMGAGVALLPGVEAEPLPDFSRWGEVEHQPMSSVRSKTARHLSYAWATIPHVTQFDKADITELEKLRKQYASRAEAAGGKLTMTVILLKIVAAALKVFPQFNASIDMARGEIIYKKYYHIGVAVDTDRGLLVPVIRDADRKNIIELSVELTALAEKARNRKLTLDDMQGGNFTISNLGGIGGTAFTPVVNSPEVAILGVSRSRVEPVFSEGEFQPRLMLPLSLSYDHRLIDGADAARFLRWIVEAIEQPFLLMLEG